MYVSRSKEQAYNIVHFTVLNTAHYNGFIQRARMCENIHKLTSINAVMGRIFSHIVYTQACNVMLMQDCAPKCIMNERDGVLGVSLFRFLHNDKILAILRFVAF